MSKAFPTPEEISNRFRRLSNLRAIILIQLYVLFMVHIIHWRVAGKTASTLLYMFVWPTVMRIYEWKP